jgi:hypothetical protein
MNIGIVELVLVFGVVLALAVIDLIATGRGVTSMTAAPEAKPAPKPTTPRPPTKPRSRKPGTNGS